MTQMKRAMTVTTAAAIAVLGAAFADAGAVRNLALAGGSIAGLDDAVTEQPIGFTINFGGSHTQAFVNVNGGVGIGETYGVSSTIGPIALYQRVIAPFFADVDTRPAGATVYYGTAMIGSNDAFGVRWENVGYYNNGSNKRNTFEMFIIDQGSGDFDLEFNYDLIAWDVWTNTQRSASAGWSLGPATGFELPGSGVTGAFLSGGANDLVANSLNSDVLGRYLFSFRDGVYVEPTQNPNDPGDPGTGPTVVPTPAAAMSGLIMLSLMGLRRRRPA